MTTAEAWGEIQDYLEGQDDLTDEQCEAVDVLNAAMAKRPAPLTDIGAVTLADGRRLPAVEAARAMVAEHGKETHGYEITGLRRAFDAYWAEVSLLLGERAPAGTVLVVEPEQLGALGKAAMVGEHADQCRLHDFAALKAAGLDLPVGTVELRQGDGFCAVTPEGDCIESN